MKRFLSLLVLSATVGTVACQRDSAGPEVDPLAARVSSVQVVDLPVYAHWWSGNTVTFGFQVFDLEGKPLPGVGLRIRTTAGNGSVGASRATADSLGKVTVQWTLGAAGQHAIEASVAGSPHTGQMSAVVREKSADRVRLSADSVTLAGPACVTELSVSGVTSVSFLGFSIDRPDVLGGAIVNTYTGSVGWMYQGIRARTPGTARVSVADGYGGADTVRVRVLDGKTSVTFQSDTLRVAVGDSTHVPLRPVGACGPIMHPTTSFSILRDTAHSATYSLDAGVALLRGGRVVGVKAGTTRLATKFYGAVDTAVVVVQ